MRFLNLRFLFVFLLYLLLISCAPSYRSEFYRRVEEKGYNEQEQESAYYFSFRQLLGKWENGEFKLVYSVLPKTWVRKQLDSYIKTLEEVVDYKNEEMAKYLKTFGLRGYFEHRLEVFRAIHARVHASELKDTFEELMGMRSWYQSRRDRFGRDHGLGYDPSILLTLDFRKENPFESATVNQARESQILKETEKYILTFHREFDHREPDPNYPDDKNRFVWKPKDYKLVVTKSKILEGVRPQNNFANYLEIRRVGVSEELEQYPAVKGFLSGNGSYAVVVIDVDDGKNKTGYGLPDFVEKVEEWYLTSPAMFERIFPNKEEYKLVEPKLPEVKVEIAKAGKEFDFWEYAPDAKGWTIPFPYKIPPLLSNYNVRLKFKEGHKAPDQLAREIEYVLKEWTDGDRYRPSIGMVVEYFKPNAPYDKVFRADVLHQQDTKKVQFIFTDGKSQDGFVGEKSAFTKDRPELIAYTLGDTRYLIKDENGDGVYEKRKRVSADYSRIGVYE
ncbi:MAG: hypothetical protein Q8R29_02205 [bacterium]|nr:hypothetical protein [bacterium]